MFFGVNLAPVHNRLGINVRSKRDDGGNADRRNQVPSRPRFTAPFTSKWKVEVHNLTKDVSWQDLKDFCFHRTKVRPSHADVNRDKRGIGTICFSTEGEMKTVLQKLSGANFKGKPLKVFDQSVSKHSSSKYSVKSHSERKRDDKGRSERRKTERSKPDQHRHGGHRENRHRSERHQVERAPPPESTKRDKDETKVVIHERNGDRVITERISNHTYSAGDDGHHSENEQTYFKRDRRTSRNGGQDSGRRSGGGGGGGGGGRENGLTDFRLTKRTRALYKYGMPYRTKWRLRVENLASEVSWQDLKDLIRPYADVRYADAHKPVQGIGNICVSSAKGLMNVIEKLNNTDIKGMVAKFIDDSDHDEESIISNEPIKRERSRSPHHRSHRSRDVIKRSKSK